MAAGDHFKWPKITFDRILDQQSILIAFLAISDQYATFNFFDILQNGPRGPFGGPKITFDRISRHFRSIRNFSIFINFFEFFFTKWPSVVILDDRKSFSIAFLAISDQHAAFLFFFNFTKWPPKITFDCISRHFRSIRNFFCSKWLPAAILDSDFAKFDRDLSL